MEFGISKCAVLSMKRGKKVVAKHIVLPSGEVMMEPGEEGYKYLGILEFDSILKEEMKQKIRAVYFKRLKLLAKSKLNGRNLFLGINSWAVSVVRYSACIVDWNKAEIEEMDRKTRKILAIYGAFHPKSNVTRLYMKRKFGGRGLISVKDCIEGEIRNMYHYIANSDEELLKFVARSLEIDENSVEDKGTFEKRVIEEKKDDLKGMKLHGQFEVQTENLKTEESWNWLSKGDLKRETESLLMAAQEQALNTNSIKKNIYKTSDDDKCRLCGNAPETITHIVSACKKLAQKEYLRRHDKVCLNIHWQLCVKYGLECNEKWYQHTPSAVHENDDVKLLWNFPIQVDRELEERHNRPDIMVFKKNDRHCLIVDIAVPGDHNIESKQQQKIDNYADLKLEVSRMWDCSTVVVPIIIGALGSVPKKFHHHLAKLEIGNDITTFQKSAVLGTASILRKILTC